MRDDKRYLYWGITIVVSAAACIMIAAIIFHLPSVLALGFSILKTVRAALYGIAIAYLINPLVHMVDDCVAPALLKRAKMKQHTAKKLSRSLGILFAYVVLALIIYLLIKMIFPQLTQSVQNFATNLPGYYRRAETWALNLLEDHPELSSYANQVFEDVYSKSMVWLQTDLPSKAQSFVTTVTSSAVLVVKTLLNLLIGLIVSVYVLFDRDQFLAQSKKITIALLKPKQANRLMDVARRAHKIFGGFITGKILDSLIIGVLCYIGMQLLRMPYPVLVATIIGVTNVIPFFGPYLGAIPCSLLILLIDPMQCLYFVIFILILQQIDGNIIGPRILGEATGISSFWVVVSITAFGGMFGVLGMIIGVPLFAVLYMLIGDLINDALHKRNLTTDTGEYYAVQTVDQLPEQKDVVKNDAK
ncbi:MAG: AI-2E family transporter [Oscillospiraceae bacterium]|nr:AI-2E family transporter [Oscillospiraceae bacterium]